MDQPWASLVVGGHKRIETRPRRTPTSMLGQRVAVHANKTIAHLEVARDQPFALLLPKPQELPRGYILGTVVVAECRQMDQGWIAEIATTQPHEFKFGDWTDGRWGWVLKDPLKFEVPMPFKAHQGWPDVDDGAIQLAANTKVAR